MENTPNSTPPEDEPTESNPPRGETPIDFSTLADAPETGAEENAANDANIEAPKESEPDVIIDAATDDFHSPQQKEGAVTVEGTNPYTGLLERAEAETEEEARQKLYDGFAKYREGL